MIMAESGRSMGTEQSKDDVIVSQQAPFISGECQLETFTLDDGGHDARVTFSKLYTSKQLQDFTILCRKTSLRAHRLVLAVHSQYFHKLLLSDSHSDEYVSAELDFDPDVVEKCLKYMYTGIVKIRRAHLEEVSQVAEKLQIRRLHRQCVEALYRHTVIVPENCLQVWRLGYMIENKAMVSRAKLVAAREFNQLQYTEDFTRLPSECVKEYLTDDSLQVRNVNQLLMAALFWTKADNEHRQHCLPELLNAIPLIQIEHWVLENYLKTDEAISQNVEASRVIQTAFSDARRIAESKNDEPVASVDKKSLVIVGSRAVTDTTWLNASDQILTVPLYGNHPVTSLCTLPAAVPSDGFVACCVDDTSVYVSGLGHDRLDVWSFSTLSNSWSACGQLVKKRLSHCMASSAGTVFVFGGWKAETRDLEVVNHVEMFDTQKKQWKIVGQLKGKWCTGACCCVHDNDIIVFGIMEGFSLLLQTFSTSLLKTTNSVALKYGCANAYGVVVVGDSVITCDSENTCVCPLGSLREKSWWRDTPSPSILHKYKSPTRCSVMALSADSKYVFMVGGHHNASPEGASATGPSCHRYIARVSDVLHDIGEGCKADFLDDNRLKAVVRPGACAVLQNVR